jgi:hypothetical protein
MHKLRQKPMIELDPGYKAARARGRPFHLAAKGKEEEKAGRPKGGPGRDVKKVNAISN